MKKPESTQARFCASALAHLPESNPIDSGDGGWYGRAMQTIDSLDRYMTAARFGSLEKMIGLRLRVAEVYGIHLATLMKDRQTDGLGNGQFIDLICQILDEAVLEASGKLPLDHSVRDVADFLTRKLKT
jgi:hypothetical protein